MHTYTRRKKLRQAKVGFAEDKISNLHDSILTHILSFLPMKNAIRTGILSTRWKCLWASVPTLCLSEYDKRKENIFVDFVDRVLVRHMMPFLEEVNISGSYLPPPHIESWISAAVEQNVRNLRLEFYGYKHKEPIRNLPQSLFTLNRIVSLDLDVRMVLSFPVARICFPNLKFLRLCTVIYEDDNSAQNLISSCPVLEELVINRDGFDDMRTLNVISQSLKKLSLFYCMIDPRELDHVPKVVIDCPALEYIDFEDDVTGEYVVRNLSSIIKARLCVSDGRPFQQLVTFTMHIFELLRRISNVKVLSLSSFTMLSLSTAEDEILPTFHNLTCLEFDTFEDSEWNWKKVIEFLKTTPILEVLIFEGLSFSHEEFPTSPFDVPNCLLSHLKTIKVNGFLGGNDVEKVRYFLENAKVLENMTVKLKGGEEILQLLRSSKACQISSIEAIPFMKAIKSIKGMDPYQNWVLRLALYVPS